MIPIIDVYYTYTHCVCVYVYSINVESKESNDSALELLQPQCQWHPHSLDSLDSLLSLRPALPNFWAVLCCFV